MGRYITSAETAGRRLRLAAMVATVLFGVFWLIVLASYSMGVRPISMMMVLIAIAAVAGYLYVQALSAKESLTRSSGVFGFIPLGIVTVFMSFSSIVIGSERELAQYAEQGNATLFLWLAGMVGGYAYTLNLWQFGKTMVRH